MSNVKYGGGAVIANEIVARAWSADVEGGAITSNRWLRDVL